MIIDLLLLSILILNIVDIYTTYQAISNSNAKELNPIVRFFIDKLGLVFGLLLTKAIFIAFIIAVYQYLPIYALIGINILYIAIIINNLIIIKKQ